jgi:CBS domain-containing protein
MATTTTTNKVIDLLQNTNAGTFAPNPQRVIAYVNTSNTVLQAFNQLTYNNILSAPVLDDRINRYVGFIDMKTIVSFAISQFTSQDVAQQDMMSILRQKNAFSIQPISNIEALWRDNPFIPVPQDASLYDVVEIFLRRDVHRVPVVNQTDNTLINVITRSRVVEFLYNNMATMDPFRHKTIRSLALGWRHVPKCMDTTLTLDAFHKMVRTKTDGLAVLDADDHFIGGLSVRDLRAIGNLADFWTSLYLPTNLFLNFLKKNSLTLNKENLVVGLGETVETVVRQIVSNHIHRVYILDNIDRPIGVIELGDILRVSVEGVDSGIEAK